METMKKKSKSKKKTSETEKTKSEDDRPLTSTQESPLPGVAEEKTQDTRDSSLQDSSNVNPSAKQRNEEEDSNIVTEDIPMSEFHPITSVPLTPDLILDTPEIFHTPDSLISNVQNMETTNSMSNIPEVKVIGLNSPSEELKAREEINTPNTGCSDNEVYMTPDVDIPSPESNPSQTFELLDIISRQSQEIPSEHTQSRESTVDADEMGVKSSEHVENEGTIQPVQVMKSEIKKIPFKIKRIEDVLKDFSPLSIAARKNRENPELGQENKVLHREDDNLNKLDELESTTKHQEKKETSNAQLTYVEAGEKKLTRDIGIQTDMVFIARPLCILAHEEEFINERTSGMKPKSETLKEAIVILPEENESSLNQEQETAAQPETVESIHDEQSDETVRHQKPPVHVMRFLDAFNSLLDKIMAMRYSAYKANNQLKWLQKSFPPIMKEILTNLSINDSNDENDERESSTDLKSRKNKIFHLSDEVEEELSNLVECLHKNHPEEAQDLIQRIRIAMNKFYIETVYLLKDCKYVLKNYDGMLQYNARENLLRIRIKTDFKRVSDQLKKSIEGYILARERFILCSDKYLHKQLGLNVLEDTEDTPSRPSSKRKTIPITVNRFRRFSASIGNAFRELKYRIDSRF